MSSVWKAMLIPAWQEGFAFAQIPSEQHPGKSQENSTLHAKSLPWVITFQGPEEQRQSFMNQTVTPYPPGSMTWWILRRPWWETCLPGEAELGCAQEGAEGREAVVMLIHHQESLGRTRCQEDSWNRLVKRDFPGKGESKALLPSAVIPLLRTNTSQPWVWHMLLVAKNADKIIASSPIPAWMCSQTTSLRFPAPVEHTDRKGLSWLWAWLRVWKLSWAIRR